MKAQIYMKIVKSYPNFSAINPLEHLIKPRNNFIYDLLMNKDLTEKLSMKELSSDTKLKKSATVITSRAHDLLLDYIKESTEGLSKMSINRIRRVCMEKDEWDALKAFENVASEQQKIYARTFCKPALKTYQKKKKNFDMVAAHISYDITPKILPQYDFQLPVDENSLTSEQAQEYKQSIQKLSRDFRLQSVELYLKIVKEESEFQNEKLEKLPNDFPSDKDDELPPLTRAGVNGCVNNIELRNDEGGEDDEVFTQRPLARSRTTVAIRKSSELFTKYIEISLKRCLLETEREILFLAEKSVQETPFVIQEAQELTQVLRKDFVLLA